MGGSHCVKSVRIQIYYGPHFPAFGLNTESENADQNNSEYGHFSRSEYDSQTGHVFFFNVTRLVWIQECSLFWNFFSRHMLQDVP